MLSFRCQKNSLSLSIPLLLEVLYMEHRDDGFLEIFSLNMCAPRIMALLVPVHLMFIREFQQLQFCGSCSYNEVLWDLTKLFFDIFYKFLVVSRGKCTTKLPFQLINIDSRLLQIDHFSKNICRVFKKPFPKEINFGDNQ